MPEQFGYMELNMKIIEKIINVTTNVIEEVERDMTSEELNQWQIDKAKAEEETVKAAEAAAQKSLLLARLGLTEEEAELLLS